MHQFLTIIASTATEGDLEGDINSFSIKAVAAASALLIILLIIASQVIKNKKHKALKVPLFISIAATILLPTLLLIGSTIYVNTVSESKGPVHWHTDIEFWACGQEIEYRDPYEFLSNKVGTSTYHEHDDKRIHLEGVVIEKAHDASLEKFMAVTGGAITNTSVIIPTNDDIYENDVDGDKTSGDKSVIESYKGTDGDGRAILSLNNGDSCGGSTRGELQTFLLRYEKDDDTYTQTKLEDPKQYIMRDESVVPPGDCVIVEFDVSKSRTDKLCEQYGVRHAERCTEFGVTTFNPDLCNIKERSFRSPAGVDI